MSGRTNSSPSRAQPGRGSAPGPQGPLRRVDQSRSWVLPRLPTLPAEEQDPAPLAGVNSPHPAPAAGLGPLSGEELAQ